MGSASPSAPAADPIVVRTKFIVPLPRKKLLSRPRLAGLLAGVFSHRLVVVQAGPGYGKSTSVALYLSGRDEPLFWYSASGSDADPHVFMTHLIWSMRPAYPQLGDAALSIISESRDQSARRRAVESLANDMLDMLSGDAVLVIDDYHSAARNSEIDDIIELLVDIMPPHMHVVLSTRQRPALSALARWRVKGDVLEIGERDLAFTDDEIRQLFAAAYQSALDPRQVRTVADLTEGWVIALEMMWHALREGISIDDVLTRQPANVDSVFDYLAQEVLLKQRESVASFLIDVSVLDELDAAACAAVSGRDDTAALLAELSVGGVFLYSTGPGSYRFHNLIKVFLRRLCRRDPDRWVIANRRAAMFYADGGHSIRTVDHLLEAGDFDGAAERLVAAAPELLATGLVDGLAHLVEQLPGAALEARPDLLLYRADAYRLTSDYSNALAWYSMADEIFAARSDNAGRSRALKGKATVFLDTVEPAKSEALLAQALELLPEEDRLERATLMRMMAESKTNLGQGQEAMRLLRGAEQLINQAMEDELDIRVHLRTGRLAAALALLERRAGDQAGETAGGAAVRRPARSHRETQLLLSLAYCLIGQGDRAVASARAGIRLGQELRSPFVEAVGYMRLGHALRISATPVGITAEECYRRALSICDGLRLTRGRAEPLMGLAMLHAAAGDVDAATAEAAEALAICRAAGDEWMAGFVQLGMATGLGSAGGRDLLAAEWVGEAHDTFVRCGDEYCTTVCELWQAVLELRRPAPADGEALRARLDRLFRSMRTHSYEFLFTRRTIFGPTDLGMLAPLLVEAARLGVDRSHVQWLSSVTGLGDLEYHPGYTLHVRTLGRFTLYRGNEEVANREWQREKAKTLFQLLLVNRKGYIHRDQILDSLWPGLESDVASRHFKVALNAMLNVIEPHRPPRLNSFTVHRDGQLYAINPMAGLWTDADEFESLATKAGRLAAADPAGACDLYRHALSLYHGDFLQECLYEDWATAERERLLAVYLRAAGRTAELLLEVRELDECIDVCEQIIAKDPCWEEAYRILIQCAAERANPTMALRLYERCETALQSEMGISPSRETRELLDRATRQG